MRKDLQIANMIRDEINEILGRYDVSAGTYEQDVRVDASCVILTDNILARLGLDRELLNRLDLNGGSPAYIRAADGETPYYYEDGEDCPDTAKRFVRAEMYANILRELDAVKSERDNLRQELDGVTKMIGAQ